MTPATRFVDAAIRFHVDVLGLALDMHHAEEERALVAGVSRGDGCPLLLTRHRSALYGTRHTALDAGEFATLRAELEAKGATLKDDWWGKPLMVVEDPDGNQLYFPHP